MFVRWTATFNGSRPFDTSAFAWATCLGWILYRGRWPLEHFGSICGSLHSTCVQEMAMDVMRSWSKIMRPAEKSQRKEIGTRLWSTWQNWSMSSLGSQLHASPERKLGRTWLHLRPRQFWSWGKRAYQLYCKPVKLCFLWLLQSHVNGVLACCFLFGMPDSKRLCLHTCPWTFPRFVLYVFAWCDQKQMKLKVSSLLIQRACFWHAALCGLLASFRVKAWFQQLTVLFANWPKMAWKLARMLSICPGPSNFCKMMRWRAAPLGQDHLWRLPPRSLPNPKIPKSQQLRKCPKIQSRMPRRRLQRKRIQDSTFDTFDFAEVSRVVPALSSGLKALMKEAQKESKKAEEIPVTSRRKSTIPILVSSHGKYVVCIAYVCRFMW